MKGTLDNKAEPPAEWLEAHQALTAPDDEARRRLLEAFPVAGARRPGGVTTTEAAELWNIKYSGASHRLMELVRAGKMKKEPAVEGGRQVVVFYWV